jgi:hypothetical protein
MSKTDHPGGRRSCFDRFFFDWFPGEALGAARLYFGFGLIVYLCTQYRQLLVLDPLGFQFHYTLPIWYFDLLGIDHMVPWLNVPVMAVLVAACAMFALGRWTKPAIIVIILAIFYLKGVRDSISGDVHHREVPIIAILVLFLFSKCDQVFGIDARRKGLPGIADWEASWPLRAMQVYIAMFYFWALVAKLRLSGLGWFTDGGRIQDVLLARALRDGLGSDGQPVKLSQAYELAQNPDLVFVFGATVFVFELLIPFILFVRDWRWRVFMLTGAAMFHFSNYYLLNVQFYLYPFVFVTFFNMAVVHRWLKAKFHARGSLASGTA